MLVGCESIAAHLAAGSMTVSESSSMNLWIEQVSALETGGCRLWWSQISFRFYQPLRCLTVIGILLTFERNRFIRDDAENFPFLIKLMAS